MNKLVAALIAAWRSRSIDLARLGYRALLWVTLPAWVVMRAGAQWIVEKEGLGDTWGGIAPTVRPGDGGGATPSAEASAYNTPGGRAIPQCVQWWCISVSRSWQLGQWMWMAIYTSQDICYTELRHSIAHPSHRTA